VCKNEWKKKELQNVFYNRKKRLEGPQKKSSKKKSLEDPGTILISSTEK
jgi:hypothetical protein